MWMGVKVVQYLVAQVFGECCGRVMFVRNIVEGSQDSRIDSSTVVEKSSSDGLHSLGSFFVEWRGQIFGSILYFLAVDRGRPRMASVLSPFGGDMVEFGERFGYILRHGDVNETVVVVLAYCENEVACTSSINSEEIFFTEFIGEVLSV